MVGYLQDNLPYYPVRTKINLINHLLGFSVLGEVANDGDYSCQHSQDFGQILPIVLIHVLHLLPVESKSILALEIVQIAYSMSSKYSISRSNISQTNKAVQFYVS